MTPITRTEVLDIAQYERIREDFRTRVLAQKEARRVQLGPHFTLLFENHQTVLYQIQEMMRVERMVDETAIAHEIETYNELIPSPGQLSATLLIAYDTPEIRAEKLGQLLGLEHHLLLEAPGLPPAPALFDQRQVSDTRLSSVQYIRFALNTELHRRWRELGQAGQLRLVANHPHYQAQTVLTPALVAALAEDLD